jgi:hypothetical protein
VRLTPGASERLGTVELRYDVSAWLGPSTEVGHRGPALLATIDRAEAGGGAYGNFPLELIDGESFHFFIGPYRFEGRSRGGGVPPAIVEVSIEKNACPEATTIDEAVFTGPISMWVSTEAIRQHTMRPQAELLQARIMTIPDADHGGTVRFEASALGFSEWFELEPGQTVVAQPPGYRMTVDMVTPGPGTRFLDGRWEADDNLPKAHARVRVERIDADPVPARRPADTPGCGAATLTEGPGRAPAAARGEPTRLGVLELAHDVTRKLGGLELTLRSDLIPALAHRPDEGPEVYHHLDLRVIDGEGANMSLGTSSKGVASARSPQTSRVGDYLVQVSALGRSPDMAHGVEVEVYRLGCPQIWSGDLPAGASTMWLGTLGHEHLNLALPDGAGYLSAQIYADRESQQLLVSSERGSWSAQIGPELVGTRVELSGHLVRVVALEDRRQGADELRPAIDLAIELVRAR